jgi:hypothetical protein
VVLAVRRADGTLAATSIRILYPAGGAERLSEFTGLIEVIEERRWVVGAVEICLAPQTAIAGQPKPGVPASVRARWSDGCWEALDVRVHLAMEQGLEVEFEGSIQALGPSLWVVSGVAVELAEETTVVGTPELGRWAEVSAVLESAGRLRGLHVRVLSPSDESAVELGGLIAALSVDQQQQQDWAILVLQPDSVATQVTVRADGRTFVDQSRALAAAGMWADVSATRGDDGLLLASRIRIERPISVEVEGTLAASSPSVSGWWQVADHCVYVDPQTATVGAALEGMSVTVEGFTLGNGCIWAERVGVY